MQFGYLALRILTRGVYGGRGCWRGFARICASSALLLLFSGTLLGQSTNKGRVAEGALIGGQIVDQVTGESLPSAQVAVESLEEGSDFLWKGTSGVSGDFLTAAMSTGIYEIRVDAVDFSPLVHVLAVADPGVTQVRIEMVRETVSLEPVVVVATRQDQLELNGFRDRRGRLLGTSLSRGEIEARGPVRVSDLFYGIPGIRVFPSTPGNPAQVFLRNGCVPQVVVDGAPFSFPVRLDEVLTVGELEAVEIYQGSSASVRYSNSSCGTIMLWTRQGAASVERTFGWRQFVGAAVFFGGMLALGGW